MTKDALRVLRQTGLDPEIHFVESSPILRAVQGELLESEDIDWHESLVTLPPGLPLLLVANEFFDALPVRQFVGGIERRVIVAGGGLAFDRDGDIVEDSPSREKCAREIGAQLDVRGGVAIIIDYGHAKSASGDTLQSIRKHEFSPPLANPGEQDLTAHVDFEALAKAAAVGSDRATELVNQGKWLKRLGIEARAEALANANPNKSDEVYLALARLTDAKQMGELFKVIAIHSRDWHAPAGFE